MSILEAGLPKLLQWLAYRQDLIPQIEIVTMSEVKADKMMPYGELNGKCRPIRARKLLWLFPKQKALD